VSINIDFELNILRSDVIIDKHCRLDVILKRKWYSKHDLPLRCYSS